MDRHLLFFYGTLMTDRGRGGVLRNRPTNVGNIDLAVPVARGTIRGLMYDAGVGAFPAVVDGDGVVHGEVWEAPSEAHLRAALTITDRIEGYREGGTHNLYDRIEVPLLSVTDNWMHVPWARPTVSDEPVEPGDKVLVYRYNTGRRWDLGAAIPSGDWRDYRYDDAAALAGRSGA